MGGHVYPIDSEFSGGHYTDHYTDHYPQTSGQDYGDSSATQYSCGRAENCSLYHNQDNAKVQLHIPKFRPSKTTFLSVKSKAEASRVKSAVEKEGCKLISDISAEHIPVKVKSDKTDTMNLGSGKSADCRFKKYMCHRVCDTPTYLNSDNKMTFSSGSYNNVEYSSMFSNIDEHADAPDNSVSDAQVNRVDSEFDPNYQVKVQYTQSSEDLTPKLCPQLNQSALKMSRSYCYDECSTDYSTVDDQHSGAFNDQSYMSYYSSTSCYYASARYSDMSYSMNMTETTNEISSPASEWPSDPNRYYGSHPRIYSSSGCKPCVKKLKRGCRLWEFIRNLLLDPASNPSLIRWEDRSEGMFKLVQSKTIANMWGMKKGNRGMTYEKLSRAMRYYYKRKVFAPVLGKRLVYKFGPRAVGWRE